MYPGPWGQVCTAGSHSSPLHGPYLGGSHLCPHRKAVCAPSTPESFPGGSESRGNLIWLPASPPEPHSPEASLVHSVSTAPASVPLRPHPSLQVLPGQEAGVALHQGEDGEGWVDADLEAMWSCSHLCSLSAWPEWTVHSPFTLHLTCLILDSQPHLDCRMQEVRLG